MNAKDVRNWLGIYFLFITGSLGAYLLLFRESALLPISEREATDCFEILIPVLLAQLTMIFRWFSGERSKRQPTLSVPTWIVVAPPVMVTAILLVAIGMLVVGNMGGGKRWAPSPSAFKAVVTFSVSILNATTVLVISKYFGKS